MYLIMPTSNTACFQAFLDVLARKSGNGYVLNGSKTFITNGQHANLIVVVARTDPGLGARASRAK